jgi:5'-nucleotidase
MIFNQDGLNIGFYEPVIHVFNKNEFTGFIVSADGTEPQASGTTVDLCHPQKSPLALDPMANPNASHLHRELVRNRRNVLLMGDSVGDRRMADGVKHDTLLTVGYMNRYKRVDDAWFEVGNESADRAMDKDQWAKAQAERQRVADEYASTFDVVIWGDVGFDVGTENSAND